MYMCVYNLVALFSIHFKKITYVGRNLAPLSPTFLKLDIIHQEFELRTEIRDLSFLNLPDGSKLSCCKFCIYCHPVNSRFTT